MSRSAVPPDRAPPGKQRRPRFQFRLRSLLALIFLLALPAAWIARDVQQFRAQWQAASRLEERCLAGGSGEPTYLSRLGIPGCTKLVMVELYGPIELDDARALAELPFLQRLGLNDCQVSDAAWAVLGRLRRLQTLHIAYTDMSDEQLGRLAGLENLRELMLTSTGVTEDAVSGLQRALPALRVSDD